MADKQTTVSPAPERKYHSVCPKCKGALTPVPSGSICLACADTLIFATLKPHDERLSKRMADNAAYPLAKMTGLQLTKGSTGQLDCLAADVWAIDGLPGLYVRAKAFNKDTPGAVQARSKDHYLWVFWRWGETKVLLEALLEALKRELHPSPEAVIEDTSPEYDGKKDDPLSSEEKA